MSPSRAMDSISPEQLQKQISTSVASHESDLAALSKKIHENPEIRYEEYQAHDNICDLFETLGYSVTRHAYGLETSFEIKYGKGGRLVVFNAEYDALPGIGHACGHNLIATGSAAAFIATAEAIRDNHIQGRVRVLGCPAEESGGGKIRLIKAGAYEGVDACLQGHPAGPSSLTVGYSKKFIHGIAATKSTARKQVHITFKGINAHAGMCPWEGKNALDALVASYVNISLLRQQIPPAARIHGIVHHGGNAPNIIPDTASLEYGLRHSTAAAVDALAVKVDACFQAGALATGCTVDCSWDSETDYKDLCPNATIARTFTEHMSGFGKDFLEQGEAIGASTDMGNVSYIVPGFHCMFTIETDDPQCGPHQPNFATAAGTRSALLSALDCGKGMAATGYDILVNDELAAQVWRDFEQEFGKVKT